MKYKAFVNDKLIENGKVRIFAEFRFGNGNKAIVVRQDFLVENESEMLAELRKRLLTLESLDEFAAKPNGEVVIVDPVPPVIPTSSPIELKKKEYFNKYEELFKKKAQLNLGLITEAAYNSFKDEVKAIGIDAGEL